MSLPGATDGFSWKARRVLVTGVTGSLGCWLSRLLCDRGARLTGLTRRPVTGPLPLDQFGVRDRMALIRGDIGEYEEIIQALQSAEPDVVFHLAAVTPPLVRQQPRLACEFNIRGTWNLLEAIRVSARPVRVVLASTQEVYGETRALPYTEEMPLRGRLPYGASKACSDLVGLMYQHTYGIPVGVARLTMLYGGGDLNLNRLVPSTIRSVLRDEPPVVRSDGRMLRDYLYVTDAAEAMLLLAERLAGPDTAGQVFHLSSGTPRSVLEIVQRVVSIMGRDDLVPRVLNQASGEIPEMYASCRKAQAHLRWSPRFSLDDGLRETVAWYRRYWNDNSMDISA